MTVKLKDLQPGDWFTFSGANDGIKWMETTARKDDRYTLIVSEHGGIKRMNGLNIDVIPTDPPSAKRR